MSEINCETSKGGAVYGKVFHDVNRNGVFDFGETGFQSPNRRVLLELVDCSPFSVNCDEYDYGDNVNYFRRTLEVSLPGESRTSRHCPDAETGGCFEFVCNDCFGQYQLVLSREIDPRAEGWKTSPVKFGNFREGWELHPDPPCSCDVHNNFESFKSECFRMFNDMTTQQPFETVLDFGLYFDRDPTPGALQGIATTSSSVTITNTISSTSGSSNSIASQNIFPNSYISEGAEIWQNPKKFNNRNSRNKRRRSRKHKSKKKSKK